MALRDVRISELFVRFAPVIHRRAMALLGDFDEAHDVTQDVFVILLQKIDSFRGDSSIFTWLYRVTTNHCLNVIRARKRRQRALEQLSAETEKSPDPGRAGSALERRDLIRFLLSHFDTRKVQVVTHYYYDDMSQAEIGALLGISDRAVRKTLSKVKHKMVALGASMEPLREVP